MRSGDELIDKHMTHDSPLGWRGITIHLHFIKHHISIKGYDGLAHRQESSQQSGECSLIANGSVFRSMIRTKFHLSLICTSGVHRGCRLIRLDHWDLAY